MSRTYRVTSEIINFSLVEPDETAFSDVVEDAKVAFLQMRKAIQRPCEVTVTHVDEDEDEVEDASTLLGHLAADYYRNGGK